MDTKIIKVDETRDLVIAGKKVADVVLYGYISFYGNGDEIIKIVDTKDFRARIVNAEPYLQIDESKDFEELKKAYVSARIKDPKKADTFFNDSVEMRNAIPDIVEKVLKEQELEKKPTITKKNRTLRVAEFDIKDLSIVLEDRELYVKEAVFSVSTEVGKEYVVVLHNIEGYCADKKRKFGFEGDDEEAEAIINMIINLRAKLSKKKNIILDIEAVFTDLLNVVINDLEEIRKSAKEQEIEELMDDEGGIILGVTGSFGDEDVEFEELEITEEQALRVFKMLNSVMEDKDE